MALSDPRHRTHNGSFVNAPAFSWERNLLCKHQVRKQKHPTMKSCCLKPLNLNDSRHVVLLYLSEEYLQFINMLETALE